MGSSRTVGKRSDEELLREYNALFSDKTVQKVMRYLVVRDELCRRYSINEVKRLSYRQRIRDAVKKPE